MNTQELLKFHEYLCGLGRDLMARKNHDYAGADGTAPFANFERVEAMGITTTGKGFLVRMVDKLSRLSSFEAAGKFKVEDEKLVDTVVDIINYAVLYLAQRVAKEDEERNDTLPVKTAPPPRVEASGPHSPACVCSRCKPTVGWPAS